MKNTLYIDTTKSGEVEVELKVGDSKFIQNRQQEFGSQVLLNLIQVILKEANINTKDLDSIKVKVGPGSFTGIRVGVSVANALAFALNIPVNGKKLETDLKY